ncbi:hypothetical protein MNBD_GAMMA11-1615, partial [hydrothermal vent metagenome]
FARDDVIDMSSIAAQFPEIELISVKEGLNQKISAMQSGKCAALGGELLVE